MSKAIYLKIASITALLVLLPVLLFCQVPKLMLPIGHTSIIYSAVYSPATTTDPTGGKYILTASDDQSLMLWNGEDGKLLLKLIGHTGSVRSGCFSPDGKNILSASDDSTIKIWDAFTGNLINTLSGFNDLLVSVACSPLYSSESNKEKTIIACTKNDGAYIRKINDPAYSIHLSTGKGNIKSAQFSPNGISIITSSRNDSMASIWNTGNGKLVGELMDGHKKQVNSAVFSPDGKTVVTSSVDNMVYIWDAVTFKKIGQLNRPIEDVLDAKFSADGKWIVTSDFAGEIMIWDAVSLDTIKNISIVDKGNRLWGSTTAEFSPNGKFILTNNPSITPKTWLVEDGSEVVEIKSHTSGVKSAIYIPSGKQIITIHNDGSNRVWVANNGKLTTVNKADENINLHSMAYGRTTSYGSRYIVNATSAADVIVSINGGRGPSKILLKGHTRGVNAASFSPDGFYLVTASDDGAAMVWNIDSCDKAIISMPANSMPKASPKFILKGNKGNVIDASFSPDGKYIVTACHDKTAIIWNAEKGIKLRELVPHPKAVLSASFSPNSEKIITTCNDGIARLWEAASGKLLDSFYSPAGNINDAIFSPRSSDDAVGGKFLLTAGPGKMVSIWNGSNSSLVRQLEGHTAVVTTAIYSPDGKYILSCSEDNSNKVWDASTGSLLYTFIAVNNSDYLVIDADGRYDGTEGARKLLYFTCGIEPLELEQFKDLCWEPGLAAKIMGSNPEPITAKKISEINICNYTPVVIGNGMNNGSYYYKIIARQGGIGEIELYVNDRLIKSYDPKTLPMLKDTILLTVDSSEVLGYFGSEVANKVEVKATTSEGNMTSRGVKVTSIPLSRPAYNPNIYIIAIGISQYRGEKLKLGFASKDAADFTSAVTASAKNLLNTDGKEHVFAYTLNTETGNDNWPLKKSIKLALDKIADSAKADDIVVMFFAGHGVLPAGQKTLYLLTAEATSFEIEGVEKEVSISTDELNSWMQNIKANKQVLILDACNSGQAVKNMQDLMGRGNIPADQERALESLKDKSGTYILSASASGQSAYESGMYNQGLLTYSLLSGIKRGDGLRSNKFIDITQWFNTASSRVQILAKDIGGRQDPQIIGSASFDLGLANDKVKAGIVLSEKKKVFGRSMLIGNIDDLSDSLDLTSTLDQELMNRNFGGRESKLAFAADSRSEDTYTIRGRYSIKNENISITISVYKGQKEKVTQFTEQGNTGNKEKLVVAIVEKVQQIFR